MKASEVVSYRSAVLSCVTSGGYQKLQFGSGVQLFVHDGEFKLFITTKSDKHTYTYRIRMKIHISAVLFFNIFQEEEDVIVGGSCFLISL